MFVRVMVEISQGLSLLRNHAFTIDAFILPENLVAEVNISDVSSNQFFGAINTSGFIQLRMVSLRGISE